MIILKKHQERAVSLFKNKSVILAHEMGTGKSITSIFIHKEFGAVVICPSRTKNNYYEELLKVEEKDVQIIETSKDEIKNTKWLIVSYGLVDKFQKEILENYKRVIVDESHYIKGNTKRSNAVVNICKNLEVATLLTGTPVMNKPIELWNQLVCVNSELSNAFNKSYFSKKFCGGHLKNFLGKRFWWEGGANNLHILKDLIKNDVDVVVKSEVLDLPNKTVYRKIITMIDEERKIYKNAFNAYLEWCKNNPEYTQKDIKGIISAKQLVELGKLRQVTSEIKVRYFLESKESLPEKQSIIFTGYNNTIELLNKELKKAKLSFGTIKEKDSIEKFKQKKVKLFTANILSGGVGLNLQNASNVFIIDEHWTPAQNDQAEARIHRWGQEEQCSIWYYEVKDTVDEYVAFKNNKKRNIINQII